MEKRALILFAHGARDPRWAEPFQRLQTLIRTASPAVRVELAFLELMSPRLPEIAQMLALDGIEQVTIVPVFLGQGGHVRRDLPEIIDGLRAEHPHMQFQVAKAVGEEDSVLAAMASYCLQTLT
ncbi:CbiX/SirB N-terminal domain-containing protein [uncultured Oxalicibacterium sp.]|uniref:sirohydrochlorin chelatase n=1 Tax=uncultured Oxalicibacterium sp. TaxID=1168540 RepID=UPI0025F30EF7|nr:CbiX/SirB N-terminal domain-containing protein [uncultured Oxalicibacterium sp.]